MYMMVHEVVSYKHHAGHETGGDWAAVVALAKEGGEVKMARYHIIVVSRMLLSGLMLVKKGVWGRDGGWGWGWLKRGV